LQALEGTANLGDPNIWLHVELDGTIRFLNPLTFTPITLTMGAADRVDLPSLSKDLSGCFTRVLVRGNTWINAIQPSLNKQPGSSRTDGGLQEDYAHDGLTNAQAKSKWTIADWQQPGQPAGEATATAAIGSGAVTSVSPQYNGYNYSAAPVVTISGGGGSGATATATISGGSVTGYSVTAGGTGYTSVPSVLVAPPGPPGSFDQGTCTCSSTTNIVVTSTNAGVSWAANYWDQTDSGRHGTVTVFSDTVTGVAQMFTARIVACTALTAGGTSTLTIDVPLPSTNYTAYQIFAQSGGANQVGRKFKLSDATQGQELMPYFPYAQPIVNSNETSATLTSTPIAIVWQGLNSRPMNITIDPVSGTFLTQKPVQLVYSADGKTAVWPDNVTAFLAVSNGALSVVYPPDSGGSPVYSGTAHSDYAIARTKTISVNDWRDPANTSNMLAYATNVQKALATTVQEGTLPYAGLLASVLAPGFSVNIAADDYTTGYEASAIPGVSAGLTFNEGGGGTDYDMAIGVSSRRAPYAASLFTRPAQTGRMALSQVEEVHSLWGEAEAGEARESGGEPAAESTESPPAKAAAPAAEIPADGFQAEQAGEIVT
jgi:hypothetical protein